MIFSHPFKVLGREIVCNLTPNLDVCKAAVLLLHKVLAHHFNLLKLLMRLDSFLLIDHELTHEVSELLVEVVVNSL